MDIDCLYYRIEGYFINLAQTKTIYFSEREKTIKFDNDMVNIEGLGEFNYYKRELAEILTREDMTIEERWDINKDNGGTIVKDE